MRLSALLFAFALAACASTDSPAESSHAAITGPEPASSQALLDAVGRLEGAWVGSTPDGTFDVEFRRTSAGSAVIETMMPGTASEMVNLYTVHGEGLNMTHYCAAGNQPHMRAVEESGGQIAFRSTGVSGREALDEHYMAEMTLVFVDEDHVEQHWRSGDAGGEESPMVFHLERR